MASAPQFLPARPEDQNFIPARPEDTASGQPDFVPARPEDQHWYSTAVKEVGDVASGFKTALNQTGESAMNVVGATGIPQRFNPQGWEQSRAQTHEIASRPLDTAGAKAGNAIENIIEFAAGDEILKGASMLTKMRELRPIAEALKKSPTLTRIMGNAVRTGAVSGGQTAAHGGGVADTLKSAAVGAGTSGLLEGVGVAREAINNMRPISLNLAGAEFPALATGRLNMPPLNEVAADPITQAVEEATGNIGKTGIANSLRRANAGRAVETPIVPPSRQLSAPAESTPGFRIKGAAEPVEGTEGQMAQPPRKKQTGTRVVEGKGPGEFDLERYQGEKPPRPQQYTYGEREVEPGVTLPVLKPEETAPIQRGSHREPQYQYLTSSKPGTPPAASDVAAGPGTLILTNDGQASSVMKARQQLAQYEQILGDEGTVSEMPVRQHQQLLDAHADLSDQLRRYDEYAASQPHFPAHDVVDAVRNTTSLGEAGQMLKDSHAPFWTKADKISGGEFSNLREQEKFIEKKLYSPNPVGNLEDLKQQLADNQQAQLDFFDRHRADVSPEEWKAARDGYQDGIVMGNLHNFIERSFNGVTREEVAASAARGRPGRPLQRVFDPSKNFNQQLENFYNTGTNRDVLERTIGANHMLDLKELGQLFETSERREATKNLAQYVGASIRRHGGWIGSSLGTAGGAAAFGFEHAAGAAAAAGLGMAGKGTVSGTLKFITDRIATDPEFGRSFLYAVKNALPPRVAAPLLAAKLILKTATKPGIKALASSTANTSGGTITQAVKDKASAVEDMIPH